MRVRVCLCMGAPVFREGEERGGGPAFRAPPCNRATVGPCARATVDSTHPSADGPVPSSSVAQARQRRHGSAGTAAQARQRRQGQATRGGWPHSSHTHKLELRSLLDSVNVRSVRCTHTNLHHKRMRKAKAGSPQAAHAVRATRAVSGGAGQCKKGRASKVCTQRTNAAKSTRGPHADCAPITSTVVTKNCYKGNPALRGCPMRRAHCNAVYPEHRTRAGAGT